MSTLVTPPQDVTATALSIWTQHAGTLENEVVDPIQSKPKGAASG
jgi:hypothetical protein